MSWNKIKYTFIIFGLFIFLGFDLNVFGFHHYQCFAITKNMSQEQQSGNVSENQSGRNNEKMKEVKTTKQSDISQPAKTSEPEKSKQNQEKEKEVKRVKNKIEHQIQQGKIENIEIKGNGKISIKEKNKQKKVEVIQPTEVNLLKANVGNSQVSLNINQKGQVTITNNGIKVVTNYPVVVDPATLLVSIKTPSKAISLSISPASAIKSIPPKAKPLFISSASLIMVNNNLAYNFQGKQTLKLFGLIPISVDVKTAVDSQTGRVIKVEEPWYAKLLNPLSTI